MNDLNWTEQDAKALDIARVLAADAVEKVGNGHPGTAISLAPIAYLLYQKVMKGDPADPRWLGRDRFVRNCLYAAGNSGSAALLPQVAALVEDADPAVADAAHWALARLTRAYP